jgi:hypothetical protein
MHWGGAGSRCRDRVTETQMTESTEPSPAKWPFEADQFWCGHALEDLFAGVQPLAEGESFMIEDLTDEWDRFWAAINE